MLGEGASKGSKIVGLLKWAGPVIKRRIGVDTGPLGQTTGRKFAFIYLYFSAREDAVSQVTGICDEPLANIAIVTNMQLQ